MKISFITFFLFISLSQQSSYSQIVEDISNDFNDFINTSVSLSKDLVKFDKSEQLYFAGSAISIGIGYSVDNNVKSFSQRNLSTFNNVLFSVDKVYGSGYTLIGIAGLYGYGLLIKDKEIRQIGLQTIEAVSL